MGHYPSWKKFKFKLKAISIVFNILYNSLHYFYIFYQTNTNYILDRYEIVKVTKQTYNNLYYI